jgi:hypothetical protein
MAHHIFRLESELQNIPEAALKAPPSFSVSEKLARYSSSALSGVEHLTLLVGKESAALALIRHFGTRSDDCAAPERCLLGGSLSGNLPARNDKRA